MKRYLIPMGICALLSYTSCKQKEEQKEENVKLLVTSPIEMDTTIVKEYVGQVRSIRHIELRAQERGYLQNVYVDEGQFVHKGQPLFQIMPNIYQAEAQKAAAEVNFANIEYQNTKRLADSNVVAPNELAMAKAKLARAKADLALNNVHLQFTKINAPFDGIIDKFAARPGSLLDEGDLLSTLADNSQMWVYFNVPEAEYLDYKAKAETGKPTVSLLMANQQVFDHPGVVETVEADFDNETGNIPFRATFPNPKGLLRHGETGNIRMVVPLKNAIIIPQKATFEVLDKRYVYVVDKDNKVRSRQITVGAEMEDLYAVTEGLKPSDKILLEGLKKVKEGDKISYDFEKPESVIHKLKLPTE
ncbi:efflux RND transporter periplasmic adaptor subunit [Mucilaginibacter auburnensis]|uniref:Membrane fusion protein (Multidrug efflux system) n=1 Tax=Mucilaginibacter auburnensis TaxID=1457233 RepID=A0A2H9VUM5_9SPHI|nr:efflux RND transporter periplasmic adaptor subunit [Mucilaginibacter auburnensis]PJJ84515.1 membrane fusion protein (multidrug efflux system) [Mucilaginibacter auburnensis]